MHLLQEKNLYLSHFEQLEKELSDHDPPWLRRIRKAAIARFNALGFPTARNEDWRFTNLAGLAKIPFFSAESAVQSFGGDFGGLTFPAKDIAVVFVNGRFQRFVTPMSNIPAGVFVSSLAQAMRLEPNKLGAYLGRHARFEDHAFTALNTACFVDGLFIEVPKGQILDGAIHLMYFSAADEPTVSHPRNLIVGGENSQAAVVEHHLGTEDEIYFTNAVTEIIAGENSVIDHYKIQEESKGAFHIANTQVVQARGSKFSSHYISLGGSLVRNETRVLLDGENCEATVNGLYRASGRQHVDNFTVIDHAKPHCASHELYKGILTDHAHAVFSGKIFVRPDAQKTDAKQTNQVLLLSDDAVINTKPQLEIFADDVKCTHGATVGQLQEEAIFYLRSRGIGLEEARGLLTFAFANDVIGRIKIEALRDRLEKMFVAAT